jgi:hypothetical protein
METLLEEKQRKHYDIRSALKGCNISKRLPLRNSHDKGTGSKFSDRFRKQGLRRDADTHCEKREGSHLHPGI